MDLNSDDINQIVRSVINKLDGKPSKQASSGRLPGKGIFESLDDAVTAASESQKQIRSLEFRAKIIQAMRETGRKYARELAGDAVAETGMGRVEDKYQKNLSQAEKTPGIEDLHPEALSGDHGLTLTENAAWGVIASVTPSTNPAATVINNSISMISAGNAIVFAPHPAAKNVTHKANNLE